MLKNQKSKIVNLSFLKKASSNEGISVIAEGTIIEGNVQMPSDLRLDGTIIGNVTSDAKVILGETAKIKGNVDACNFGIKGEFEGELRVRETLHIHNGATVEGTFYTKRLVVKDGAQLNCNCNVNNKIVEEYKIDVGSE